MRRKDKEITEFSTIENIIRKAQVCRLGLVNGNEAYIVPVNFGYADKTIYFHSAQVGRKIEILNKNPFVCLEFDIDHELLPAENPMDWSMKYRSVMAYGKVEFIESISDKAKAFDIIFAQYSDKIFKIPEVQLDRTAVLKIPLTRITGKQSGFPEDSVNG